MIGQPPAPAESDQEAESTRLMLDVIETRDHVTQRSLAGEGNVYLASCGSDPSIGVQSADAGRTLVPLTAENHAALLGFIAASGVHALVALAGDESLWTFALLQSVTMFFFGLVGVNFNAMAMEPLGRIAGTGSSVLGSVTTVGGALIGFYVGQQFDGTVVPLTVGFTVCGLAALAIVFVTEGGRLFRPTQTTV